METPFSVLSCFTTLSFSPGNALKNRDENKVVAAHAFFFDVNC